MNIIGIIPARMASSRFPGKPLAKILGKPMIYHVYMRSKLAIILEDVYVATCDREIEKYCLENDMKVIMTKDSHERASDRAAEAMSKIEKETGSRAEIIVMIQGDEPMLNPKMIDLAVEPIMRDDSILITNLMAEIKNEKESMDPNTVKVVVDENNFALYFSREPIPSQKKTTQKVDRYKQVPVIPFRRDFLITFNSLPPKPLETIESVDMLRLLEHGNKVKMILSQFDTYGVDTSEDLVRVEKLIKKDPLLLQYKQ